MNVKIHSLVWFHVDEIVVHKFVFKFLELIESDRNLYEIKQ